MLRNNKGFSLIELMVVVAIIAILSTIAIPSYQQFQARARQKEGFGMLSAYYQAAHASKSEYDFFPGNLKNSGFATTGLLGYSLTSGNNAAPLPRGLTSYPACVSTENGSADANCGPNFRIDNGSAQWDDQSAGAGAGVVNTTIGPVAPAAAGVTATAVAFQANAAGVIHLKANVVDEYLIDQSKNLTVVTDGLND